MLNLRLLAIPPYALTMAVVACFAIGGMQLVRPLLDLVLGLHLRART